MVHFYSDQPLILNISVHVNIASDADAVLCSAGRQSSSFSGDNDTELWVVTKGMRLKIPAQ